MNAQNIILGINHLAGTQRARAYQELEELQKAANANGEYSRTVPKAPGWYRVKLRPRPGVTESWAVAHVVDQSAWLGGLGVPLTADVNTLLSIDLWGPRVNP
jgi:hypothetical protein